MIPRGRAKAEAKREWFLQFAHAFYQEFAAAFGRTPHATWRPALDEPGWIAYARSEDGREVSTPLPHNFGWFRPQPVARSVVTRLIDQLGQQDVQPGGHISQPQSAPGREPRRSN